MRARLSFVGKVLSGLVIVAIIAGMYFLFRKTPGYVIHSQSTMYEPLGVAPWWDPRAAYCPRREDGAGAIVGGHVLVERRPDPIVIKILIYRNQDPTTVFEKRGDPRDFQACGVAPGMYTLKLEYPPNDAYLLGNLEVKPSLAARVIFTVEDK